MLPTILNRGLSLIVALAVISTALENPHLGQFLGGLLIALPLIWFGDFFGSITGYVGRGGTIDSPSPGWLVCSFGWLLLFGMLFLSLSTR